MQGLALARSSRLASLLPITACMDVGLCPLCDTSGLPGVPSSAVLPRLESLVRLQARLEERQLEGLARESAVRIASLHRALHDVTAPSIELREVDSWARNVRRYLSADASREVSARVTPCALCGSPKHPSRTSKEAYENLEHLGLLTEQLAATGSFTRLVEAGRNHVRSLHPVVHDPSHPGVNYAQIIRWRFEAERAYRSVYSWTMDGRPHADALWLSLLSWAGSILTVVFFVASGTEASIVPRVVALLLAAVWVPWSVLYLRRCQPHGIGFSTVAWLTVLFPFTMAILAVTFVWRNPAWVAARQSRTRGGRSMGSVSREDDWLPRSPSRPSS